MEQNMIAGPTGRQEVARSGLAMSALCQKQTSRLIRSRRLNGAGHEPRRSAVQVPEQEPPLHEPPPIESASRPEPLALLPPALTVTVIAPVSITLPVTVNIASPALMSWPRE